jgi:hypothetical protein
MVQSTTLLSGPWKRARFPLDTIPQLLLKVIRQEIEPEVVDIVLERIRLFNLAVVVLLDTVIHVLVAVSGRSSTGKSKSTYISVRHLGDRGLVGVAKRDRMPSAQNCQDLLTTHSLARDSLNRDGGPDVVGSRIGNPQPTMVHGDDQKRCQRFQSFCIRGRSACLILVRVHSIISRRDACRSAVG